MKESEFRKVKVKSVRDLINVLKELPKDYSVEITDGDENNCGGKCDAITIKHKKKEVVIWGGYFH